MGASPKISASNRPRRGGTTRAWTRSGDPRMTLDLWLGAVTAAGLFAYLVYALVFPERF